MGALEEAAKATGGFIETMRSQPLVLMMGLMNIGLLLFLFYYLSRITARTENTVAALFTANDKLYAQWGIVIKDTQSLTEKAMHCILPEDALKLLQLPPRTGEPASPAPPAPLQRPKGPEPFVGPRDPRAELNEDPPKPSPVEDDPRRPVHIDVPPPPVEAEPKPAE